MEIRIDLKAALLIVAFIVPSIFLSAIDDSNLIRGYEIVSDELDYSEDDYQSLSVTCPEDKVAIGGGAGIFFSSEEGYDLVPVLVSSFMYPDNRGWYAEAIQPEDAETEWYLEVQVICATIGD